MQRTVHNNVHHKHETSTTTTTTMKRKVVQHGPGTLTISLPSTWAKQHNIKKGDEVILEPRTEGLLVHTPRGRQFEKKTLDIRGLNRIAARSFAALYKAGYDEITLLYENADELQRIQKTINNECTGYEVISETDNTIEIKQISSLSSEDFNILLRRIFFFLTTVTEETSAAATNHNKNAYEKNILRDQHINKLANFCRRIVNKHGQTNYKSDPALYTLIEELEKLGDLYLNFNKALLKRTTPPTKELIETLKETNKIFQTFKNVCFQYSLNKLDQLLSQCFSFLDTKTAALTRLPREDIIPTHILLNTVQKIADLNGIILLLNA
ncbi:AbrB/MazE/SpoVT family DNA-binding domain-containing protein [Candidatus Woesearchaeota archaeon]|nr:MAG: AbrB/MazE/SpoVT family DNA-binding domain-containing protein [Candidatus Woesearchaeota archaeon]